MDILLSELSSAADRIAWIVTEPTNRTYWVWSLGGLAMAIVSLTVRRASLLRGRWPALRTTLAMLFDPSIWLHRSAIVDYYCYIINAVFGNFLVVASWAVAVAATSSLLYLFLMRINGGQPLSLPADGVALTVYSLLVLLWLDLSVFVNHILMHRVPLLWEFHKVHHSAQVLTPVTVHRIHPIENVFVGFAHGIFTGTSGAVGFFVFGQHIEPWGILGLNIGMIFFSLAGGVLRHSQVWLPYPSWLSHILLSPAQHQIHHSSLQQHHDRNFGLMFGLWDWVWGTLYVPRRREPLVFGLVDGEDHEYQSVSRLYLVPFKKIWMRMQRKRSSPAQQAQAQAQAGDRSSNQA